MAYVDILPGHLHAGGDKTHELENPSTLADRETPRPLRNNFFCGEGPRSRCYGSTAAVRLIVQPCDEDEEKDDRLFIFPSNGAPVE